MLVFHDPSVSIKGLQLDLQEVSPNKYGAIPDLNVESTLWMLRWWGIPLMRRGGFIFQQCLSTDTSCNFEILGGFVGFLRNSGDYWQKFSLHPPAVVSERLQISFTFCGNFILISQVIHASLCFEKELFGNLGIQLFTEWSIDSAMETMIGPIL